MQRRKTAQVGLLPVFRCGAGADGRDAGLGAAVWQNACYPGMVEPRRLGLLGTCRGCWDQRPKAPPIG